MADLTESYTKLNKGMRDKILEIKSKDEAKAVYQGYLSGIGQYLAEKGDSVLDAKTISAMNINYMIRQYNDQTQELWKSVIEED